MAWALGLNGQTVKHSRLPDGEIADVDHLLHFPFAFSDDLAGFERDQLPEFVLELAKGVAQTSNGIAANRTRRLPPFLERLLRARNSLLIIIVSGGVNAADLFPVDRRDFLNFVPATAPLAVKNSWVILAEREFFEH